MRGMIVLQWMNQIKNKKIILNNNKVQNLNSHFIIKYITTMNELCMHETAKTCVLYFNESDQLFWKETVISEQKHQNLNLHTLQLPLNFSKWHSFQWLIKKLFFFLSVRWVGVYEIILRVLDAVLGYTVKSVKRASSNLALHPKNNKISSVSRSLWNNIKSSGCSLGLYC